MKTVTLGFIRSNNLSFAYDTSKYQYYYDAEKDKMYKIKRAYVLKVLTKELPFEDEDADEAHQGYAYPQFDW